MKKNILEKSILYSVSLLNAVFLVYWCVLGFYARLHYDDIHFLWKMNEMSIFDYVKDMYFTRSGRFVGYGINGVVSVITTFLGFSQFWAIFYYALGIGICWLVVKDMKLSFSRFGLFMGVCFVYNLYVLTNIDFPVFFWLCAMTYYLLLPTACLLLKYLNKEKLNWSQWLLYVIIVFFIGGGNEAFSPIVLLIMFFNGLYLWRSKWWDVKETWSLPQIRRIVWSALAMLILMTIVVVAPGNYSRMADTSQFAHPSGLQGWVGALINAVVLFFYFMVFYIPYYSVAFSIAYYFGGKKEYGFSVRKSRILVLLMLGFFAFLVISSLPNVYLYNGFGLMRPYTTVVLALLITIVAIGYVLGMGRKQLFAGWCSLVGVCGLVVIMCINVAKDFPTAKTYGKAVDERIEHLCDLRDKGQKGIVTVAPLPIPYTEDVKHFVLTKFGKDTPKTYLYYISDVGQKPNEYMYHMKRWLNLDFDFVVTEKDSESFK